MMNRVVFDGYNVTVNGRLIEAMNSRSEHPDMRHYLRSSRLPGEYETVCGRFVDAGYVVTSKYAVNCMACLDTVLLMWDDIHEECESYEVESTGVGAPVTHSFYY